MKQLSQLFLRLALSASYLSAVVDRFGFWGQPGSPSVSWGNWENFVNYAHSVNSFLPKGISEVFAIAATILEVMLPILLIAGYQLKYTSLLSGFLLLGFALAMFFSFGVKAPLDYSVFTGAAASFVLSAIPCEYSLDDYLSKKRSTS